MPGGTLVLLYHRVADLERDPYGLAVHPERFEQHCDILRRRCEVVPLRETDGRGGQVAITFDDGYADNCREAREILAARRLPATFFITVGRVGSGSEVWWDRLEYMLLGCEPAAGQLEIAIEGRRFWGDIRSAAARRRVHLGLYRRLRPLRPAAIQSVLVDVAAQLGVGPNDRPRHRWMNTGELCALAATASMEIGAHTVTHPLLSILTTDEQWTEIDGSRTQLERLLTRPVKLFSYPYGGHEAFDAATTQLVRESGYAMACTATGGLAMREHYPFRIPRNMVGDWDASEFERRLEHWLR